jgi:hypothetical protein
MESDALAACCPAPAGWPYAGNPGYAKSFNMATNDWDVPTHIARFPGDGSYIAALVAKHPTTEDIYYNPYPDGWWKWTQATNTWSKLSNTNDVGGYAGAAIDPTRNRMLVVGQFNGTVAPRVRNLDGSLVSPTPAFGGLGAGALTMAGYPGVVYDSTSDRFLVIFNSGGSIRIRRVHPTTWAVDEPAVTGTIPSARQNGIQNAAQYVPELGGIVIANSYSGNVQFIRTSGTPPVVTTPPAAPAGLTAF